VSSTTAPICLFQYFSFEGWPLFFAFVSVKHHPLHKLMSQLRLMLDRITELASLRPRLFLRIPHGLASSRSSKATHARSLARTAALGLPRLSHRRNHASQRRLAVVLSNIETRLDLSRSDCLLLLTRGANCNTRFGHMTASTSVKLFLGKCSSRAYLPSVHAPDAGRSREDPADAKGPVYLGCSGVSD